MMSLTARHHQHHILRFSQFGSRSRKAHFWSPQGPEGPEHASLPTQPSNKWARNHDNVTAALSLPLPLPLSLPLPLPLPPVLALALPYAFRCLGLLCQLESCANGSFSLIHASRASVSGRASDLHTRFCCTYRLAAPYIDYRQKQAVHHVQYVDYDVFVHSPA